MFYFIPIFSNNDRMVRNFKAKLGGITIGDQILTSIFPIPMLSISLASIRFRILIPTSINLVFVHWVSNCVIIDSPPPAKQFTKDIYAYNSEIGFLSRSGKIEAARQLFDNMPLKDIVTWNAIITGYWRNGNINESKRLFSSMPQTNLVSWNSMIAGCIENEMVDEALSYFSAMPRRNTASWNAMISGLVKYDRLEEACGLFKQIPRKNVISYTAMITGYAKRGDIEQARALFDNMRYKNSVSWTVMISAYVNCGRLDEARELYEGMAEKNVMATTTMISACCKEAKMEVARTLFENFQDRDLVCWNAMINGYVQNGFGEEALKLQSQMLKMDVHPDQSSFVSVFTACSILTSLELGRQNHVLVIKNGFESNVPVCNALVAMYSKCGDVVDSELAFSRIRNPDISSWNTIIAALAQHGLYEKALEFFNKMGSSNINPDGITFLSLLSGFSHAGKLKESLSLFDLMVNDYRISPRPEHYACLVDTLSRFGQLEKAQELIQEMPFEASSRSWSSLLSACGIHLNEELGKIAAKKLMILDPHNSGTYMMLSNLYAGAGKWGDATRVRLWMKEHGVKKQRAHSWIEVGKVAHSFLGGDTSHSQIDAIHLQLKRISLHMRNAKEIKDTDTDLSSF